MTFEYDEKGKFFTDIISKNPVDVLVQTTEGLIHATVHIRKDERLKDELDRDEIFLALTDASVYNLAGEVVQENNFIAVHKRQIVWVIPKENDREIGSDE